MFKTKMLTKSSILRIVALVAIMSFSLEISSFFFVVDEMPIEIVDADLEDDFESDDEFDSLWNFSLLEISEIAVSSPQNKHQSPQELRNQHLQELLTPPPDFV